MGRSRGDDHWLGVTDEEMIGGVAAPESIYDDSQIAALWLAFGEEAFLEMIDDQITSGGNGRIAGVEEETKE